MSDEEPKPIPVNERDDPCGCHHTEYSNGKTRTEPCFGHGLVQVSIGLAHAAKTLEAMGRRTVAQGQQAAMHAIAERLQAQKDSKP